MDASISVGKQCEKPCADKMISEKFPDIDLAPPVPRRRDPDLLPPPTSAGARRQAKERSKSIRSTTYRDTACRTTLRCALMSCKSKWSSMRRCCCASSRCVFVPCVLPFSSRWSCCRRFQYAVVDRWCFTCLGCHHPFLYQWHLDPLHHRVWPQHLRWPFQPDFRPVGRSSQFFRPWSLQHSAQSTIQRRVRYRCRK